jgi:anti-sigma regulatory factor (Ser/Thr protein kinase)
MSGVARFEPDFGLEVRPSGADRRVVIEVRGELDSGTCDELVDAVTSCLSGGAPELTLDLARMTFIDSAGTRALIIIAQGPEGAAAPSEFTERIELEFPRDPHSPARARAEVRESLHGREQSELATLVLLTSELVTNAVVHPRGVGDTPVMLRVMLYADRVRVEVEDCGAGFDRVTTVGPEAERGRGLFLVDQFSDRWGSGRIQTEVGPRFRVWFELDGRDEGTRAVA